MRREKGIKGGLSKRRERKEKRGGERKEMEPVAHRHHKVSGSLALLL